MRRAGGGRRSKRLRKMVGGWAYDSRVVVLWCWLPELGIRKDGGLGVVDGLCGLYYWRKVVEDWVELLELNEVVV